VLNSGLQVPFGLLQEWYPHYFVLTSSKIYYSEETSSDQGNEDEEEPKEVELLRGMGSAE
jgi:phosphatidylinositol phospholipase C gamma-1